MTRSRRAHLLRRLRAFRAHEETSHPERAGRIGDAHLADQAALALRLVGRLEDDPLAPAVVLASPTGTGKTIIALAAALQSLQELDRYDRVAIITPNRHVRRRWLDAAKVLSVDDPVTVVTSTRAPRRAEVVGFTLTSLPEAALPRRTLVILDEAHRGTQSEGSWRRKLHTACRDRAVVLVSATPYQLSTSGLVAMLSMNREAARDAELAPVQQLARALTPILTRGQRGEPPAADEIDELVELTRHSREVIDHHLIRPDPAVARVPLYRPHPKSVHDVRLDDPGWARAYWVARASASVTDHTTGDMFNRALDSSSEAFRASAVSQDLKSSGRDAAKLAAALAAALGSASAHPKVDATVRWVTERARSGRHVLVFAFFVETQAALAAALQSQLPDDSVRAPTDPGDIEELVERFRRPSSDGPGPLVLVVTDRFSESIDLDGGNPCVVHHDLHWNPNRIRQRMGRVTRLSTGYQQVAPDDVFIPVLDTPTDLRMAQTVTKRFDLGDLLIPAELEKDVEHLPPELVTALFEERRGSQRPKP